jgi:DNA-binding CsgD family transcriptional regulator
MNADVLTGRERDVAGLAAVQCTDREIAIRLGMSVRTVGTHLGRVYAKLGITGRAELARLWGDRSTEGAVPTRR